MPTELRREKIENLLREELAKILDRDVEFPERTIVTVTRVKSSVDGHYANAFVSILGADPAGALAMLKKTIYHIQKSINKKLRIRPVPRIAFKIDAEEFNRERVEKQLAGLKRKGEL